MNQKKPPVTGNNKRPGCATIGRSITLMAHSYFNRSRANYQVNDLDERGDAVKQISIVNRSNDLKTIRQVAGAECAARISMMMNYVKPEKAGQVKTAILTYARKLISENLEPSREADFFAGKNPFTD